MVDKNGEARSILNHRSRTVRQVEHWPAKIAPTMERQAATESLSSTPGRPEYIRELQRIALGHDSPASARDRVTALKELVEIDSEPGPPMVVQFQLPDGMTPPQAWLASPNELADDGNEIDG